MKWLARVAVSLFLFGVCTSWAATPLRPNILFIFIDDIGWGDLSCYGSPVTNKLGEVITPNLDKLASQGIRFTQGYVAAPICSPSRTGVLTGIQPGRYGIHSFLDNRAANASRNMANWVQPDTITAPWLFKGIGYRTGQFGKWHMGNGRDVNDAPPPAAYGFDQSLVAFEGNGDRLLYYNNDGSKYGLSQQNEDASVGTYQYCYFYEAAGKHAEAALKFITNSVTQGKPFYVHVPFNDTHSPYNVPPGQEKDFDHITSDTDCQLFLGELHNLDKQIGRIMAAIDGLGIGSNTLMVVVGDNGAPNDNLNTILRRNGGLRSGKGNIYEGGIREPFIIRWPGMVPGGLVNSNTAVSTLDLLPTYCAFAEIPLPNAPFAGENMKDVFLGSTRPRGRPLTWEYGASSGLSPVSPKLAIRSGNYKFMRDPDGSKRELYLIPTDHAEANNLVNQSAYASVVASLEPQLMAFYDQIVLGNIGPKVPSGTSTFVGSVIEDPYDVTGGNSGGTGFGANAGVNYQFATRHLGAVSNQVIGYRLGGTGGTSARQASDFSITGNRLEAAPRNGNGRFEFSPDGTSTLNFGPFLAGRTYELSVDMNISVVGPTYAQRLSIGLADASNVAVQGYDIGMQIGTDSSGGLGVFKRLAAGSAGLSSDVNVRLMSGLPINVPIHLKLRVVDYNKDITSLNSSYEIFVNDTAVNSGNFRYNGSTTDRFLIFDVAAHEGTVYYDNLKLVVTNGGGVTNYVTQPVLGVSDYVVHTDGSMVSRLYWSAQPAMTVQPQRSTSLTNWVPLTNSSGTPYSVTTEQGTIQWLNVTSTPAASGVFFRLKNE